MTKFEVGKFYRHKESKIVYYILDKSNVDKYITAIHINDKSNRIIHESTRSYYEEVTASFEVKKPVLEQLSYLSFDDTFTVPKFDNRTVYKTMSYLQPAGCPVGVFMIQDIEKHSLPVLVSGDTMVYIVSKED